MDVENGYLYAQEVNLLAMNFYKLKKLIPEPAKRFIRFLIDKIPVGVEIRRSRPKWHGEDERFSYQSKFHDFKIKPGQKVLDVGCGPYPFPYATMLVDLFTEKTNHRHGELITSGKPFMVADIHCLPFEDKSYDFVYCSHVLEHVDDPVRACAELVRVGKRGYVETPSIMTDVLFCWAKGMHKWFTVVIGNRLVFFEYGPRLVEGVRNSYWAQSVFLRRYHPLQDVFYKNQDIFNNSLMWQDRFECTVFRQDGSIEHGESLQADSNNP
jgi:SAM-dependent methyltransferase